AGVGAQAGAGVTARARAFGGFFPPLQGQSLLHAARGAGPGGGVIEPLQLAVGALQRLAEDLLAPGRVLAGVWNYGRAAGRLAPLAPGYGAGLVAQVTQPPLALAQPVRLGLSERRIVGRADDLRLVVGQEPAFARGGDGHLFILRAGSARRTG